jgi:hypothetical protein
MDTAAYASLYIAAIPLIVAERLQRAVVPEAEPLPFDLSYLSPLADSLLQLQKVF